MIWVKLESSSGNLPHLHLIFHSLVRPRLLSCTTCVRFVFQQWKLVSYISNGAVILGKCSHSLSLSLSVRLPRANVEYIFHIAADDDAVPRSISLRIHSSIVVAFAGANSSNFHGIRSVWFGHRFPSAVNPFRFSFSIREFYSNFIMSQKWWISMRTIAKCSTYFSETAFFSSKYIYNINSKSFILQKNCLYSVEISWKVKRKRKTNSYINDEKKPNSNTFADGKKESNRLQKNNKVINSTESISEKYNSFIFDRKIIKEKFDTNEDKTNAKNLCK